MAEADHKAVRERLRQAIEKAGVDPTNLGKKIGRGKDYVRDFLDERKQSVGAAEAAAIERRLGLPSGALLDGMGFGAWMRDEPTIDKDTVIREGYVPPPKLLGKTDLPVYAAAEGGPGEMVVSTEPIDIVVRPWFMKGAEGYGVLVVGDSMEPEFEAGDTALVNPRLPLLRGKPAIFISQEHEGDFRASIKRLVKATETHWIVRQFNPAKELRLAKKEWTKALRVVGKYGGG